MQTGALSQNVQTLGQNLPANAGVMTCGLSRYATTNGERRALISSYTPGANLTLLDQLAMERINRRALNRLR